MMDVEEMVPAEENWTGRSNLSRGNYAGGKGTNRRYGNTDKELMYCDHCGMNGHTKEGCFKLIGFPDWYKRDQKTKETGWKNAANNVMKMDNSPLDFEDDYTISNAKDSTSSSNIASHSSTRTDENAEREEIN
ncbi:Uncharacterized protein Adt_05003 [Abeliophyllum distichum]|uniref:CCHC-type domain-containing protein n=1 Tax=Abeliophyllum distichum TaxID=126358 RepID=A0ABD1V366_9LAMI